MRCFPRPLTDPSQALDGGKDQQGPSESLQTEASIPRTDLGIGEEQAAAAALLNGSDSDHSLGGLISTLSSEVKRSQESLSESSSVGALKSSSSSSVISVSQPKRGINVKEILKSLVAAPLEGIDLEFVTTPDAAAAKAQPRSMLPMQFHSFDR